jgi:hypothetical protein
MIIIFKIRFLTLNVYRSELQAAIWRSAMLPSSPDLDVTKHGYMKDEEPQSLNPVHSSSTKPFIPKKLEDILSCSCSGDEPCKRKQCGCHKTARQCSMFCNCYSRNCHNPHTPAAPTPEIAPAQSDNSDSEPGSDED